MRLFKKLLNGVFLYLFLTGIALADAGGIVLDWQPFVVDDYLKLHQPPENILPKNLFVDEAILLKFNNIDELLQSDAKTVNNSPNGTARWSALSKIKVTFSPGSSFMMPSDEMYLRGKDGKLTQATRTISTFLRTPSQDMAVETLKIIEPQVNLGFEF
jgi:hypothetical protein